MKRRKFLQIAGLAPLAAAMLHPSGPVRGQIPPTRPPQGAPPPYSIDLPKKSKTKDPIVTMGSH